VNHSFEKRPIVTIWENNRTNDHNGMIERWGAEAALVARPFLEVEVRRLPSGGYAFLHAVSKGQTVATTVGIATEVTHKSRRPPTWRCSRTPGWSSAFRKTHEL